MRQARLGGPASLGPGFEEEAQARLEEGEKKRKMKRKGKKKGEEGGEGEGGGSKPIISFWVYASACQEFWPVGGSVCQVPGTLQRNCYTVHTRLGRSNVA